MPITYLFYKIHKNALDSITYNYGLNYILAGVSTYFLVQTNIDLRWYQFSVAHPWIYYSGFVSALLGFFVPIILPLVMYMRGKNKEDTSLQNKGLVIGQAALLGLVISTCIKVFSGRIPPTITGFTPNGGFQFGFLRGGVFYGWPSSHTTVAVALAAAVTELYPNNTFIKVSAWMFAVIIGLGVSLDIHWFSDVIAGALIGYAIGTTVGKHNSLSLT